MGLTRFQNSGQSHFVTFCYSPPWYRKSKPQRLKAASRFGCPTARVELVPFPILSTQAGVAPDARQGILTMLTARGEFPEAAQKAPAV
jgi:hypothetical protein